MPFLVHSHGFPVAKAQLKYNILFNTLYTIQAVLEKYV